MNISSSLPTISKRPIKTGVRTTQATLSHSTNKKQKDDTIQQKNTEIADLQSQLGSRPWILRREEVEMTNEEIGKGSYGEVKVAIFRGTQVAAKCLHKIVVSRHNTDMFTREMDISSKIHHPNIVQFLVPPQTTTQSYCTS